MTDNNSTSLLGPVPVQALAFPDALSVDDCTVIQLIERGASFEVVEGMAGYGAEEVKSLLASDAGREYLTELRAQREFDLLLERERMSQDMRPDALRALHELAKGEDPKITAATRLAAAVKILELDPQRAYTKPSTKIEVGGRVEFGFDRAQFSQHIGAVLRDAAGTSLPDLEVLASEIENTPLEQDSQESESLVVAGEVSEAAPATVPGVTERKLTRAERSKANKERWRQQQWEREQQRRAEKGIKLMYGQDGK